MYRRDENLPSYNHDKKYYSNKKTLRDSRFSELKNNAILKNISNNQ